MERLKNLDVLRLVAASAVIFSHAFDIAAGGPEEPLIPYLDATLGFYAVFLFFAISGFLVTQSALSVQHFGKFAWRRFLRIYPAFFVCQLLVIGAAALFFTPKGPAAFLQQNAGLVAQAMSFIYYDGWFEGVVLYPDGPMNGETNASIWSLQQEVICYLALGTLVALGWLNRWVLLTVIVICLGLVLAEAYGPGDFLQNTALTAPAFASGALAQLARKRHRPSHLLAGLCLAVFGVAIAVGMPLLVFPVISGYLVLYLATAAPLDVKTPAWLGDVSYGVYLYGWPAQQAVRIAVGPEADWLVLFLLPLPLALACGVLSWRLVEAPALRLKNAWPAVATRPPIRPEAW